jgi:hypothetical protein
MMLQMLAVVKELGVLESWQVQFEVMIRHQLLP